MPTLKYLIKKKDKLITEINLFSNFIKGTVYLSIRKCSNSKCQCNHGGEKHKSYVLSYSKNGKTKTISLKRNQHQRIKKLTENYKEIKTIILQLTDLNVEIIKQEKNIKK